MDDNLRAHIDAYLSRLKALVERGMQLRDTLARETSSAPANGSAIAATRAWQEECGVTINELSGGSKAHWLARSFSEAFLMRAPGGQAVEGAAPVEIVQRLIGVLEQAMASLSGMGEGSGTASTSRSSLPSGGSAPGELGSVSATASAETAPHRFDFVHNAELRPLVEQAYLDTRRTLEHGEYDVALRTACGILEAIVTDALEHKGQGALMESGAVPADRISDWSFDTRLAVAERAGLIRGGCARLPAVARTYRDHSDAEGEGGGKVTVSERDARVAGQVLHVVMRDLDPGR